MFFFSFLFYLLIYNITNKASFFISFASSHGGGANATVSVVAQCQRDSRRSPCETCVTMALKDARLVCGFSDGAFVFRDACTVGYSKDKEDMKIFPDNLTTHITMWRFDNSDVTIQGKAFEEAVGELGRAVAQRVLTSP